MDSNEEKLREASAAGEEDRVHALLAGGVAVNDQHKVNGWTALHWAAKRGYVGITRELLKGGADKSIETNKGECASQLTDNQEILDLLGCKHATPIKQATLPITPNYIANPKFPYLSDSGDVPESELKNPMFRCQDVSRFVQASGTYSSSGNGRFPVSDDNELVLKVRIANSVETDYIEIELDRYNLTFEDLMSAMCQELKVERCLVYKVRKLPDTIVRKDKDVKRLNDFQELELVLTSKAMSSSSRGYCAATNEETILY